MRKSACLAVVGSLLYCSTFAQSPGSIPYDDLFCPVDTAWKGDTLVVPHSPLRYSILLKENDLAHNPDKGTSAALKGGFGGLYYDRDLRAPHTVNSIEIVKNEEGWLYLSLLDNKASTLGDGGGLLRMRVEEQNDGSWAVVPHTENGQTINYRFFDADALGGTFGNDGIGLGFSNLGSTADKGNIYLYDGWASSNADIQGGMSTTNYTLPAGAPGAGQSTARYKNMGWIIEVNKNTGKPLKKVYQAGRARYGGVRASTLKVVASDDTAYVNYIIATTQTQPAVILKYEPFPGLGDQISAFRQDSASYGGSFIPLNDIDVDGTPIPFSFEELTDIRKIALEKGATMFNNLGSIVQADDSLGNLYYLIAETGADSSGTAFTAPATAYNGKLARHLETKVDSTGNVRDPYGRILKLYTDDAGVLQCRPYLQGGVSADGRYTFSNPKHIQYFNFDYRFTGAPDYHTNRYLLISEEVPNSLRRKNPSGAVLPEQLINETYVLNLRTTDPDPSNLRPFAIGPKGAEVQGAFSIEGMSPLFLSLRYPNTANTAPYNSSLVIAVNNFEEYFSDPTTCGWTAPPPGYDTTDPGPDPTGIPTIAGRENQLNVWPNPATRTLYFSAEQGRITLFDVNGRPLKRREKTKELDVFDLAPGLYLLQNDKGQTRKILIQ